MHPYQLQLKVQNQHPSGARRPCWNHSGGCPSPVPCKRSSPVTSHPQKGLARPQTFPWHPGSQRWVCEGATRWTAPSMLSAFLSAVVKHYGWPPGTSPSPHYMTPPFNECRALEGWQSWWELPGLTQAPTALTCPSWSTTLPPLPGPHSLQVLFLNLCQLFFTFWWRRLPPWLLLTSNFLKFSPYPFLLNHSFPAIALFTIYRNVHPAPASCLCSR